VCPGCTARSSRSKGWGEHPLPGPATSRSAQTSPDRVVEAEVVVHEHLLLTEVVHGVDAGQARDGLAVTRAYRLRRGRNSDPEWINRRRLLRAAERLTDEQRTRLFEQLISADPLTAAAWIAKELLRDVLACRPSRPPRGVQVSPVAGRSNAASSRARAPVSTSHELPRRDIR
jgi:hypothetical protein